MALLIDGMTLPHCAKGQAKVHAQDGLLVRDAAATGKVLGKLTFAEVVTVWVVDDGWAIVQTDDGRLTGWASMAYLTPIGELTP